VGAEFVDKLEAAARTIPPGAPAIPVGHPLTGAIGHVDARGLRLRGISSRAFRKLCSFEERWERDLPWRGRIARAMNPERFDLERFKFEEAQRLVRREAGAITTWDSVLNARANGGAEDEMGVYSSITTVANSWSTMFRAGGTYGVGTYSNIPGGATKNGSVGTLGVPNFVNVGSTNKKYLLNYEHNQASNTAFMLLVDLLVVAGNINANSASAQTVNSTALSRYSGTAAAGNYMTFDITTALGATPANITVTYTNSAGTGSRSSGAQAMTTSGIVMRLQPTALGQMCPFQSGDNGVRSVESVQLSAAMGAGVIALNIYRPLLFMPNISGTSWVARSTPGMLSGITELVKESGNEVGCLTPFVCPGGTSTGLFTYFIQTVNG
jgi:hypothetical protein